MANKMNMDDGIAEVLDAKSVMKMETDFALMQKGRIMFKVPNGQDPYSAIGKYIRNHITAIEDMIAVIKINEVETNQLFMVDINEENYFIWKNDWWEGEEDVTLIDFFPVSEAQHANQIVQSTDTISRRDAIEAIFNEPLCESGMKERTAIAVVLAIYEKIKSLPSAQPDLGKYEYHYDHTDCIWYRPEARNRCPVTCAQYRDGWNDAMNYIFRDGKGYRHYRRGEQYEE